MWTPQLRHRVLRNLLATPLQTIRYSKQHFIELNTDYESIKRQEEEAITQKKKESIYQIASNDKNPSNYIKNIKMNRPQLEVFKRFDEEHTAKQCCILSPEPRKPRVFLSAKRKYIITSIKKAKEALRPLKKLYLHDAILTAQTSEKKVAKLIIPTLYNLIRHAIDRGYDPVRLFIHGMLIGKTQRYKNIRYHAKGRSGREKRDFCQVKVVLYEKDEEQFWSDVGTGKAPPGFATLIRQMLVQQQADYETLTKYSGITTAKGRQQKRQILKRRVSMKMIENQNSGVYVPKKTIIKQISEIQGEKAKELFKSLKQSPEMSSIKRREILYANNQRQ